MSNAKKDFLKFYLLIANKLNEDMEINLSFLNNKRSIFLLVYWFYLKIHLQNSTISKIFFVRLMSPIIFFF